MDSGALFLTGSSGFVGMELLARYLERSDRTIYALIRGSDQDEAGERLRAAAQTVVHDAHRFDHRLVAVRGDVTTPGLGIDPDLREQLAEEVTAVVHSAASVSFSLPLDEARAINVDGTRRVLELAELCAERGDGLARFSHVSTSYVAGTHCGPFYEEDLDRGQHFNNSYEMSKWEAEKMLRHRFGDLPTTVFRPSIVVGESDSGWTPAFNVVYGPLRAYSRGSLRAVPGRRSAPADVVPVDYVADAIFELSGRPDAEGRTYALAAGPESSTVGQLIDMSAEAFGRRRAIALRPKLYRRLVHPWLLRRSSESKRKVLRRSEVYFPYFAVDASFDNSAAADALVPAGIRVPPLDAYFHSLVRFAQEADWGRSPLTRVEAREAVEEPRAAERRARRPLEPISV